MNPFMQNSKLELIKMNYSNYQVNVDDIPSDGVFTNMADVAKVEKTFFMEKQEKTSVYHVPYAGNFIDRLGSGGTKLFLYLQYKLGKNEDYIRLKISDVQKNLCMKSNKTAGDAIKSLVANNVICKKTQSEYWINPMYIFKGDRVKYYNTNCPGCIEIIYTKVVSSKSPII